MSDSACKPEFSTLNSVDEQATSRAPLLPPPRFARMGAVNDKERDMETGEGKLKIYCETSFWSYLVGGPTSDEKVARWQALTRKWWEEIAPKCEIFVSQHMFDEAADGNIEKARARLNLISRAMVVEGRSAATRILANELHSAHAVPETQNTDALHIAAAAVNGLAVLLTWNCKHLANPVTLPKTIATVIKSGYSCPIIITPEEFLARREEFSL